MDETLWSMMNIVGPVILLVAAGLAGDALAPPQPGQATDTTAQTEQATRRPLRRGRAAPPRGDRRPLSAAALPPVVERWFARARLAAAPAPARDARRGARAGAARCWSRRPARARRWPASCRRSASWSKRPADGLHTLYVSPLKALAVDVQRNLLDPIEEMGLPIRVETRTGDTPSDRKARQRVRPPQILLTTPESLSLLLSYPDSAPLFAGLKTVVVDEIHAFATGQARRPAGAVDGAAAGARAGPAPGRPVGDDRRSRRLSRLARARWRRRAGRRRRSAIPAPSPTCRSCIPEDQNPLVGPFAAARRRAR